jgi:hypothetical protein
MGGKKQQGFETGANGLAPDVQEALAQLVQAQDHARYVLEKAGLLPGGTSHCGPLAVELTSDNNTNASAAVLPHWDQETRELRVGRRVVKQYRVPSPMQEAILAAFHEEGWPHHIDDPLPPITDECPKDRLRSTIWHLNSKQKNPLIRFRGDGTGEGILWEFTDGLAPTDAAANGK